MAATWKSLTTGKKILRVHSLFWWAIMLPIAVAAFGYKAASTTMRARDLQEDHSITQAVVAEDLESKPSRQLERFKYVFDVDGETYSGKFSTLRSRADRIKVGDTIRIAYSNADPGLSMRPELMESQADQKASFMSFLQMSALAAAFIGICYLILQFLVRRVVRHLE